MKIFNVQRYCVNDGPGIRTTVFMKGCPLSCLWCHNPESKRFASEMAYDAAKCLGCGRCERVCPHGGHQMQSGAHCFLRKKCIACGACAEACPGEALTLFGEERTEADLLNEVLRDAAFFKNSGGGLTLSGGEPFFQPEAALKLLRLAKDAGLNTCVETCGYTPWENLAQAAECTDCFLYDVKLLDDALHRRYTGASNRLILENLRRLDELGARIRIRCPIIPGVNDTPEHFSGVARLANSLANVEMIEVEPYHFMGERKRTALNLAPVMENTPFPDREDAERYIAMIASEARVPVRRG